MRQRPRPASLLTAGLLAFTSLSALAQTPPADSPAAAKERLDALKAQQDNAAETERKLRAEIEAIGADRRKLNLALIDTAARTRQAEEALAASQARLRPLNASEQTARAALDERNAVMAEVLAALQRMGRRPPPAILARPQDALQSVRSAILLGAVLPEMRGKAAELATRLADYVKLRESIAAESARMQREVATLAQERQRMAGLIEERQRQQSVAEKALDGEQIRARDLAKQADNLKDLIAKLEQGSAAAANAARAAERSDQALANVRPDLSALKDPGRMSPAIAFASAKGLLPLPASGTKIRDFGAPDGAGGTERGIGISTAPAAQVTAPSDGWVVYAGPFRSYGQLLILNAGGGYHVLLAGMDRISVDLGQFLLTGEPVGTMGGGAQLAAASGMATSQPLLYIEFRKDGVPVDPSPWWAIREGEKVRG